MASRLRFGMVALAGTALACALPATAGGGQGGPKARAAQWEDPPVPCEHPSRVGAAGSHWHRTPTWVAGVGLRAYRIRFFARAYKCGGISQVVFHVYWDASALPDSQEIVISLASRRATGRWRNVCVKRRCYFFFQGGTKGPRFGARPWVHYRTTKGRNYVTTAALRHGAIAHGAGSAPSTWPHTIKLRLK